MEKTIADDSIASVGVEVARTIDKVALFLVGDCLRFGHGNILFPHLDFKQIWDLSFGNPLVLTDFGTLVLALLNFIENPILICLVPNQNLVGKVLRRCGLTRLGVAEQQNPVLNRVEQLDIPTLNHLESLLGFLGIDVLHVEVNTY